MPSVRRAAATLNALAGGSAPARLADLARITGSPPSSQLAVCNTLVEAGLLTRDADGRYRLGPHVLELSRAYLERADIHTAFESVTADPEALPEHTLVLSVLDGGDVVYIGRRRGARALSVPYELGMRLPANCTASGKALLASGDDEAVRERYPAGLRALTGRSITDLDALLAELARWRSLGYAVDEEETAAGMTCVGAAITDGSGAVAGAIALSSVSSAMRGGELERTAAEVRRVARRISAELGAPAPA